MQVGSKACLTICYHVLILGTFDYKFPVNQMDIDNMKELFTLPYRLDCEEEMHRLFSRAMNNMHLEHPSTIDEAVHLFITILQNL